MIFALAIRDAFGRIEPEQVREILEGGREVCTAAGIPVAEGHSIDTPEPIRGLAVNGLCARSELHKNCDAKAGNVLILTDLLVSGSTLPLSKKMRFLQRIMQT